MLRCFVDFGLMFIVSLVLSCVVANGVLSYERVDITKR